MAHDDIPDDEELAALDLEADGAEAITEDVVDPAFEEIPEDDDEPPKPKAGRFYCAGAKRKDDDGKKICDYKAAHRWRGPCPGDPNRVIGAARQEVLAARAAGKGCGFPFNCVDSTKDKERGPGEGQTIATMASRPKPRVRISTGMPDIDRVLGGGLLLGNSITVGSPRGTGKTSLLIQLAGLLAKAKRRVTFITGEMLAEAVLEYAERFGVYDKSIKVFADSRGLNVEECVSRAMSWKTEILLWDSISVAGIDGKKADVSSTEQVKATVNYITSYCQEHKVASMLISHMTGEGALAGGQTAQHMTDALMIMERYDVIEPDGSLTEGTYSAKNGKSIVRRVYLDDKSRQGADDEEAYLIMTPKGFEPVSDEMRARIAKLALPGDPEPEEEEEEEERPRRGRRRDRDDDDDPPRPRHRRLGLVP